VLRVAYCALSCSSRVRDPAMTLCKTRVADPLGANATRSTQQVTQLSFYV